MQGTLTGPVDQPPWMLWWELPWLQGSQMVLGCQGESNQTSQHLRPSLGCCRWGHRNTMMSPRKEVWTVLQCVCVCVVWRARNPRGREINMISQPALKKFCLLVSVLHLSQLDPGFYITAGLLVWVPRVRWIQWSVKQIRILLRHDFKIWLTSQIYQWCMFIQTHWDFSEKEKNILF